MRRNCRIFGLVSPDSVNWQSVRLARKEKKADSHTMEN
jgi:hypothetical protein